MHGWREKDESGSPTSGLDDFLCEMSDIYGQTPPRTRYSRRRKERNQRTTSSDSKSSSMMENHSKSVLPRRNTLDTLIFNKMCDQADEDLEKESKEEAAKEGNRQCKRSLKLTREIERNLKLNIEDTLSSENIEQTPKLPNNMKVLCGIIETKNRFRCLRSKPVDVDRNKVLAVEEQSNKAEQLDVISDKTGLPTKSRNLQERELFHDTFSFLIRLGSTDRERNCQPQMSSEESRWQNELKDLIWLELQAFRAERTPVAQDEYLCKQREAVASLLTEIIEFRYEPSPSFMERQISSSGSDSGISSVSSPQVLETCPGCLSMYCYPCSVSQTAALRQVEDLLSRLEAATSLYPSSQALATHYPLYRDQIFTGRVKAMCLWYNMTIHLRLKLKILSKLLIFLDFSKNHSCSMLYDDFSDIPTPESSVNSSISSKSFQESTPFFLTVHLMEFDRPTYRKYIEEVLKTRGLGKSLNFFERLHTSVLRKASIALDPHPSQESDEYEDDSELKRYGMSSLEAKELNLPSYRAAFMFLTRVSLDVIHEFLQMRLEQKPDQPGPLSVRQLMREMKEGLKIACIHRNRFIKHSKAVLTDEELNLLEIKSFDDSLKCIFEMYLNYLRLWIEMMEVNTYNKNLIDEEWLFVKSIVKNIDNGHEIAGIKFCSIAKVMIEQSRDYLTTRPHEILDALVSNDGKNVTTKFQLMSVGREYQGMFVLARDKIMKSLTVARALKKDIDWWPSSSNLEEATSDLKKIALTLGENIKDTILQFQGRVNEAEEAMNETDRVAMRIRVREILHQAYKMGFDYHKEICKLFLSDERQILVPGLVDFATLWMHFVMMRCERGRGLRPRWANHGLDYLITVCEPLNTQFLSDYEFEELKQNMDRCISHVVGSTPSSEGSARRVSRSRAASPANLGVATRPRDSLKTPEPPINMRRSSTTSLNMSERRFGQQERILAALKKLEDEIDDKRRSWELIGRVTDRKHVDTVRILMRKVNFTWQRGIKVGQGRFGKVYTVVNNQTGELLAMKEVLLQPGDHKAIRRVAEELQIFEGIQYEHLVRYYGIEIQREEMLIFMEFCAEGTLESLVAGSGNGLPEIFVRKYTNQLVLAVSTLHSHGIVHRDIKTANIFLTDQANCLKLGDFGSAVQIKAHTTMPGELQGFVGTQAYMAPEVFMKNAGHGRAADIWSVGCCVIEMASGKRPWAEFDSNYQIMFKVGIGESPAIPKGLCREGVDFIAQCIQHDPKKRSTAMNLRVHPFSRNYDDVNADLLTRAVN